MDSMDTNDAIQVDARALLQDYLDLSQYSLVKYCLARVYCRINQTICSYVQSVFGHVVSSVVVCVYLYVSVLCDLCLCISVRVWLRL